jgi:hypothetical protein
MTDPSGCPERPRSGQPTDLGFRQRRMVRWLDPGPLASKEVKAAISGVFGSHADRREIEAALIPPADLDYSGQDEVWFDYAADSGDGFRSTYTVATLLGKPSISIPGVDTELPRGRFLVLGGDAVYPAASESLYRDRFLGPFQAALPCSPEDQAPDVYAIPGNHDWYDGLTSFLRIFCQGRWVGGWRTRQSRSYFALRLPHRWWLWAIDISFDRFIDRPQLAYFQELGRTQVQPGDRLILCTAKPSWVHQGMTGDEAYKGRFEAERNLQHFERAVIEPTGARLVLTLSGDLHHYARYATEDGAKAKITAGLAGGYLYPTHGLPAAISWPSRGGSERYALQASFPSVERSRRLRGGALKAPFRNPGFCAAIAVLDLLLIWMVQFALREPGQTVAQAFHQAGFSELVSTVIRSPGTLVLALLIVLALIGFADAKGWRRLVFGGLHGLVQVAIPLLVAWGVSQIHLGGAPFMALLLASVAVVGGLAAGLVMGAYLFLSNALFGRHPNEAFAGQSIEDFKGFLRIHLGPDGGVTIYPLGIERVPRRWRVVPDGAPGDPWFEPAEGPLEPLFIEEPIRLG